LGALLLDILPMRGVLAIDVGTAMFAILPLFFIPIPQPQRRETPETAGSAKPSIWQDLSEGLRYVRSWPGLLIILVMATVINLVLSPAFSLLPILVTDHFGGDALQLGWLESAFGIGVVLGGLALSVWGGFRRQIVTSLMGVVGVGLGVTLLGLTPGTALALAVGAILIVGLMMPLANGPLNAVVQAAVIPEMQGRVFALMGSLSGAMSPLGLVIAGPVADAMGVRTWFLLGGGVTVIMGLASFFIPAVMHIEDNHGDVGTLEPAASESTADQPAFKKEVEGEWTRA
jgi:DHA3 family macrolide efflux protein-like MFS transporter